jgi:DNA-binding CsgD family transcriptional regulator/pimeloyl-ACP methyl ester carboxylesterase
MRLTAVQICGLIRDVDSFSARLPGGLGRFLRAGPASRASPREQVIGFFSHRGGHVAYAAVGNGPLLLVDVCRAHHLEAFWAHPPYRELVQRLAHRFTVVRWDRPGFGLSDRQPVDLSARGEQALLERLVGVLGGGEVAVLAAGDAAPTMVRFAAHHPGAVSRLALFGTAAQGRRLALALPPATVRALAAAPAPAIHDVVAVAAAAGSDPDVGTWLASATEASADVPTMGELVARTARLDVRAEARRVRSPTLVLHREGDPAVPVRWGWELAERIPGARFVSLPGRDHLVYGGDTGALLRALVPFLDPDAGTEAAPLSSREVEVAQMVTLGLTNAEIGRRLAIQRRTVDAHLEHIRAKLGVRSRARVAAWAVHYLRQTAVRGGV